MTQASREHWASKDSAISLRRLCSFACVAETGSINRAARMLGVAQPTLSRQMRELEAALGVRLLSRHERGSELTPAGRSLYGHVERVMKCLEDLCRDFGL